MARLFYCSALLLLVAACAERGRPPGSSEPGRTNPQPAPLRLVERVMNDDAIRRLAAADCDREVACNNVGRQGRYRTRGDCVYASERALSDGLGSRECAGGIDSEQLETCLAEIRVQRCNRLKDAIARLPACRYSSLCR